jgi:nucleoside transporter
MNSIRAKLSAMMFLELAIYGSWLPLLGLYIGNEYLKFTDDQQGWVFNAFAIASITGMFFGGQLADRYFAQERFLGFSHLIGGLAMIGLAYQKTFWPFFGLMLLHCFFYVPTMSVTNAIAFANIKDSRDFGFIRLWGTVGWIAASWPLIFIPIDWEKVPSIEQAGGVIAWLGKALGTLKTGPGMEAALATTFTAAGIASIVLAVFCLFLPHTPPSKKAGSTFAPLVAFKLLAVPAILVLFIVTLFDSLVHYTYFYWASRYLRTIGLPENWISPSMCIGQFAEIPAMAALGLALKRLGWRTTMILGILGHVVRFGIYSIGTNDLLWLVILSNVMHGFAYAFFFATVYIYVDENFPTDVRTSAQSLFNLLILGIGPLLSNFLSARLGVLFKGADGNVNYHQLFLVPLGLGLVATAILAIFFHPKAKDPVPEEVPVLVT